MEVSRKTMDRMLVNLWKILIRGILWSCRGNLGQRVREIKQMRRNEQGFLAGSAEEACDS